MFEFSPVQLTVFARQLTSQVPPDKSASLVAPLVGAKIDLLPHQVQAASFALEALQDGNGAMLADEVGLGKSIEAGLIMSQFWANGRRSLLLVAPAHLLAQLQDELSGKFGLPTRIVNSTYLKKLRAARVQFPLNDPSTVFICSYQFAAKHSELLSKVDWDLVVFDEAHRLRNCCKKKSKVAAKIKAAFRRHRKLLLTATPFHNTLLELHGLASLIDEKIFGDLATFKSYFCRPPFENVRSELQRRLAPYIFRTLRKDVLPYVNFPNRTAQLHVFKPSPQESKLFRRVDAFLKRPLLYSVDSECRGLITLILRKLLASSTFAIAGALDTLATRLRRRLRGKPVAISTEAALATDLDRPRKRRRRACPNATSIDCIPPAIRAEIESELRTLEALRDFARSIQTNSKSAALLNALPVLLEEAQKKGAPLKVVIFTESRRTQQFLFNLLSVHGFADQVVLLNGTNDNDLANSIYSRWKESTPSAAQLTGDRNIDMRTALVDEFRERRPILICTEAGAEGLNLQFCAIVINYDLPWNPQRIEQRIGRCHRYGQQSDVVVVNFLAGDNQADRRVYELLAKKLRLFEGMFGLSDEILGAFGNGTALEQQILAIYQDCRTPDEIERAFDELQQEFDLKTRAHKKRALAQLVDNFDLTVCGKVRVQSSEAQAALHRSEKMLMALLTHELGDCAASQDEKSLELVHVPSRFSNLDLPTGRYSLARYVAPGDHAIHLHHPLVQAAIARWNNRRIPACAIDFELAHDAAGHRQLRNFVGASGWLVVIQLIVKFAEHQENHFIIAAQTDEGVLVSEDVARKLFELPGNQIFEGQQPRRPSIARQRIATSIGSTQCSIDERYAAKEAREREKLTTWADDQCRLIVERLQKLEAEQRAADGRCASAKTPEMRKKARAVVRKLVGALAQARTAAEDERAELRRSLEEHLQDVAQRYQHATSTSVVAEIRWQLREASSQPKEASATSHRQGAA